MLSARAASVADLVNTITQMGTGAGGPLSSVEQFSGEGEWQPAPSMQAPRSALGVAVLHGGLYAIGGMAGLGGSLRSVERFDGQSWVTAPPMSYARQWHGVAAMGAYIYVAGGLNFVTGNKEQGVERFDGTTWAVVSFFPGRIGLGSGCAPAAPVIVTVTRT